MCQVLRPTAEADDQLLSFSDEDDDDDDNDDVEVEANDDNQSQFLRFSTISLV